MLNKAIDIATKAHERYVIRCDIKQCNNESECNNPSNYCVSCVRREALLSKALEGGGLIVPFGLILCYHPFHRLLPVMSGYLLHLLV